MNLEQHLCNKCNKCKLKTVNHCAKKLCEIIELFIIVN